MALSIKNGICIFNKIGFNVFYVIMKGFPIITIIHLLEISNYYKLLQIITNLICLKQVYTFQSKQIKFENPKSSLPLKTFIIHFLTTLNPRKPKVR